MANAIARRTAPTVTVRRGPSPMLTKLKGELAKARSRARANAGAAGSSLMRDALTVGGAAALGLAEAKTLIPSRVGPLDTALVVGGVGALVLPRFIGGKMGRGVHDLTLGVLAVAAYRLGSGTPFLGEDGLAGGGWSNVEP